jgi:hypothetical protein
MYKYLRTHEKRMLDLLDSSQEQDWETIKAYHLAQIGFMQHERLIHLIVTFAFAFLTLGFYIISIKFPTVAIAVLALILTALESFYIFHYYRLENGVQRWYEIYNRICERC